MSIPQLITLVLTLAAAVALVTELLRPDLVALVVMIVLGITSVVTPEQTFAGFSGSAVMTILGISIISEGLRQTGAAQRLGKLMHRLGKTSETRLIVIVTLTSATVSLFMNNIAAVGVLLPAVMALSRKSGVPSSRLLLPLAYGTTLGGMATLLTTSNIIVSGTLKDGGFTPFGLLDFLPVGIPIVVIGTIYLATIGRKLLPGKPALNHIGEVSHGRKLIQLYRLSRELHFIKILPDSELAGKTIRDIGWQQKTDTCVVGILREGKLKLTPAPDEQVGHYDILLIQGRLTNQMMQEYRLKEEREAEVPELVDESTTLAEIVIAPHSTMIGKNLADLHFREKYLLTVLAIWRNGKSIQAGLPELPLMYGDTLLVHGSANQIHLLDNEPDLILLEEDPDAVLRPNKNYLALGITLITLTIAALGILPIAVVVLAGAVLMILTGCMSMNDAYRGIEWKAIFLIAGMWPLSTALATTGLAAGGINLVLKLIGEVPPLVIAAVLLFSSFLLTQVMSGQVASLVLAPLAMAASSLTGIDPRGLGMAVALGCSLAFATPFGHPVNIMVMNPGGYTMKDYARVGFPLTILVAITILVGLHFYWGI